MSLLQTTARRTAGLIGRESRLVRRLRPAYENLLDWYGGGKGIPWSINGVTYRVDPHQRQLFHDPLRPEYPYANLFAIKDLAAVTRRL